MMCILLNQLIKLNYFINRVLQTPLKRFENAKNEISVLIKIIINNAKS